LRPIQSPMVGQGDGLDSAAIVPASHDRRRPGLANLVVELQHCKGWTVRARMGKSALMRRDDLVVLVTFENLTERLWTDERECAW
jgi:hypothetical protein